MTAYVETSEVVSRFGRTAFGLGLLVLGCAWLGPLPELARTSFAAHMTMHMMVVAVAAPLIAAAVAGTAFDPARRASQIVAPIPASIIELVVVWAWHAPVLHHAARHEVSALVLEQASFISAGLVLWISVLGGGAERRRRRAGAGVAALLFTSMHMTLLGALFALATRPLFVHATTGSSTLSQLADQHLGGAIMLLIGGVSYLAGGLWLTAAVLRSTKYVGPSFSSGVDRPARLRQGFGASGEARPHDGERRRKGRAYSSRPAGTEAQREST